VDVQLHNGTQIEIRPIRSDDHERLRNSHARLSPETQYRRFLGIKPELTSADVHYLVDIDGADHVALVATDGDEIVAVARFVRLHDDPRTAEFAIVVGDAYQRQGLGTELLQRLAGTARRRGVTRFVATILADNLAIHRLMGSVAAAPPLERRLGTVSEVELELAVSAPDVSPAAPAMIAGCAGG
jgi:RimJ/RimL family protein N-acetyltransferase